MHFSLPTHHIYSTSSQIRVWKLVESLVELFCRNSQRIKAVDCFQRGAPSLFHRVLNATLYEEVPTTAVRQGNLELLLPSNSLDLNQTKKQ